MDHYTEWIQLVADFTVNSLQSWQWASGSVFYLLGLWSRLVSSMPYLKSDAPSLLETYVPKITEAYITSRCDDPGILSSTRCRVVRHNHVAASDQAPASRFGATSTRTDCHCLANHGGTPDRAAMSSA